MELSKNDELCCVDIRTVDIRTLKDVNKIEVNKMLPKIERLRDFAEKIENPFCFICNGMIVKTSYSESSESLENKLVRLCKYMEEI